MIYVFLAKGFEEIEALTVVDFLRRADLEVYTVGIGGKIIAGSHNIPVFCDLDESEISADDSVSAIVLPGGMPGTINLEKSDTVKSFIDYCNKNNKLISAICAAPSILGHLNLLDGKKACCFPGFEDELYGAEISDDFACTDGNIITAKGMGAAISFSYAITSYLAGKEKADKIKNSLQCPF
ncbi:MAG: DJ-1/PfpI family protein [Ruminococcus sp.]|nr:DJ-1/PfpI family protein [Candidatus Copronaster equi]